VTSDEERPLVDGEAKMPLSSGKTKGRVREDRGKREWEKP
jgi:hypothetical protein